MPMGALRLAHLNRKPFLVGQDGCIQTIEIGQNKPWFVRRKPVVAPFPLSSDLNRAKAFAFGHRDLIIETARPRREPEFT